MSVVAFYQQATPNVAQGDATAKTITGVDYQAGDLILVGLVLQHGEFAPNLTVDTLADGTSFAGNVIAAEADSSAECNAWFWWATPSSDGTNVSVSSRADFAFGTMRWGMAVWVIRGPVNKPFNDLTQGYAVSWIDQAALDLKVAEDDTVVYLMGYQGTGSWTETLTSVGTVTKRWDYADGAVYGFVFGDFQGAPEGESGFGLTSYTNVGTPTQIALRITRRPDPVELIDHSIYTTDANLGSGLATTSHVVTLPSYQAGDVCLLSMSWDGDPGSVSPTDGFIPVFPAQDPFLRAADGGTDSVTMSLYWKYMAGTEGSSVTITTGSSVHAGGGVATFRNVDQSNPWASVPRFHYDSGGDTTLALPPYYTTVDGAMLVYGAGAHSYVGLFSVPGGADVFTELYDTETDGSGGGAFTGKSSTMGTRVEFGPVRRDRNLTLTNDVPAISWGLALAPATEPVSILYAERVVTAGGTSGSGDFTSGPFPTRAGSLLVATVAIDVQNGTTRLQSGNIPTPTTTGTTWTLAGIAGPNDGTGNNDQSAFAAVYIANSPGDHQDRTFSMSSADAGWDAAVDGIDLTITEFTDALPVSQQSLNKGLRYDNFRTAGGRDPGAQEVILGKYDQEGSAGDGVSWLDSGKTWSPYKDSYVVGVVAVDAEAQTGEVAIEYQPGHIPVFDTVSGGSSTTYLASSTSIRPPGDEDLNFWWQDLNGAVTGGIFDFSMVAVEIERRKSLVSWEADDATGILGSEADWDNYVSSGTGVQSNDTPTSDQIDNPTTLGDVVDMSAIGVDNVVYEVQGRRNQRTTVSGILVDAPGGNNNYVGAQVRAADQFADAGLRGYVCWLQVSSAGNMRLAIHRITGASPTELASSANLNPDYSPLDLHDVALEVRDKMLVGYFNGEPLLYYDISADATQYTTGNNSGVRFWRGSSGTDSQPFWKSFSIEKVTDFREVPWDFAYVGREGEMLDSVGDPPVTYGNLSAWVNTGEDAGAATPDATPDMDSWGLAPPNVARNVFGPGNHAADFSGTLRSLNADLTGSFDTTGGITVGVCFKMTSVTDMVGTSAHLFALGTGTSDWHRIIVSDQTFTVGAGATGRLLTDFQPLPDVVYTMVVHWGATAGDSYVLINGKDYTPATTDAAISASTSRVAGMGSTGSNSLEALVHAVGVMQGAPTENQLSNLWDYHSSLGGQLEDWSHLGVDENYYVNASTTSLDVIPFATPGNLLVAGVTVDKDAGTFTTPTGWTLIDSGKLTTDVSVAMYYRTATGDTDDVFSPSWSTAQAGADAAVAEYAIKPGFTAEFDDSDIYVAPDATGTGGTVTLTTNTTAPSFTVVYGGADSDPGSVSMSTGWTVRENQVGQHQSGASQAVGFFADIQYAANDTRTGTVTWGGADGNVLIGAAFTLTDFTPSVPEAVDDLAGTAGVEQVVLTWTAPASDGGAITDYEVWYGVTG